MTKAEFLEIVGAPLARLFKPNAIDPTDRQAVSELQGLYFQALRDYGCGVAAAGMTMLIAEHKSTWWPTVAELRDAFGRAFAAHRQERDRAAAIAGPRTNWAAVPAIRRRLFRGWLSRHPEYFTWPAPFQHHVEHFVRLHGDLYAQRIATIGGSDPFVELTADEITTAQERHASQRDLRVDRGIVGEPGPANLLAMLAAEPTEPPPGPPTPEDIARVDDVMARWRTNRQP